MTFFSYVVATDEFVIMIFFNGFSVSRTIFFRFLRVKKTAYISLLQLSTLEYKAKTTFTTRAGSRRVQRVPNTQAPPQ
jgi:hypothetical protein